MSATDELRRMLDEFEHECFMLRVEASETRARDDVVREAYERIRDGFAERIAATLGERHPYEQRITGDGSNWGEIMRDAYDDLMATANESCTLGEFAELKVYIASTLGTIDKGAPQGADGNLDQAQVDWLQLMPDGLDGTAPATLWRGTCKPTEEDCCPICGEDLVKCNVGIGELGGAVELDPPIYHNYCPNCGRKVIA